MRLVDADDLVKKLVELPTVNTFTVLDMIQSSPTIDAKIKIDRKTYHQNYYQNVTKAKRQAEKKRKEENNSGRST